MHEYADREIREEYEKRFGKDAGLEEEPRDGKIGRTLMKKEDFRKGQTVCLVTVPGGYPARCHGDYALIPAVVKSVGRQYVTVERKSGETVRFDIGNSFRHTQESGQKEYELFLTEEDVEKSAEIREKKKAVNAFFAGWQNIEKLSEEETDAVYRIVSGKEF